MGVVSRVLPAEPVTSLAAHLALGSGRGLETAHKLGAPAVIAEMEASGLRGRGGAGFPTGVKWRTVAGFASAALPATVVVNGAEGEPGTFKHRTLMRTNPYVTVEGALIAALAVVTGPGEYLFGEETALLEVLDGRPPFRHGVDEVGAEPDEPQRRRARHDLQRAIGARQLGLERDSPPVASTRGGRTASVSTPMTSSSTGTTHDARILGVAQ